MQDQWFESWFDSPWYPILYSHRDEAEAEGFISRLLDVLAPTPQAQFLDLACGRGRHSQYIHRRGFDVTGLDLSPKSIAAAQAWSESGLRFAVHDMRQPIPGTFDYILNLFTSFGYFENPGDNLVVLRNVARSLRLEGTFVLDFFNLQVVLRDLIPFQRVEKQGISFTLHKRHEQGLIIKAIDLVADGQPHHFEERVQGLDLAAFETLLQQAGLQIHAVWGDYQGHAYVPATSPRLILFSRHSSSTPSPA